jgi:predicted HicB family RNase H-like nuclease
MPVKAQSHAERNAINRDARNKYNAGAYDKVTFRLRRDGSDGVSADAIRQAAAAEGMTLNAWILELIKDNI